jgi:hypothetical protein
MKEPGIKHKLCLQDIVLIAGVLFASFWVLGAFSRGKAAASPALMRGTADSQGQLVIYQDGQVVKEISLDHSEVIDLPVNSGRMQIEINPSQGARVAHSNCPANICVHTGWIKQGGETAICVPNKVLLEIKSEKGEYDAIAY